MPKKAGGIKKDIGVNEVGNSYVHVVKGQMQPGNKESEATPALVLSDECLLSKDLSKTMFGRVKQFASLANIRKAVNDSMKLFQYNVSIGSWFSQLKQASMEFNTEGRIDWVEVEGFTPKEGTDVLGMHAEESRSDNIVNLSDHNAEEVNNTFSGDCPKKNSKEDVLNSVCSGHFKTSMVPRTGGSILSLMDELVKGVWRQTGNDLLIIAVYAPHDLKDKQILWDYLTYEIGLEEVPLGGSSFMWCYKSATKMSKLDRFLIFENLLNTCLNITSITLERYLSDHRPILLRGSYFYYGPTPFIFFHHWIEMEGFSKVVEDAWREGPCIMVDGMWIESPNRVKGEFFHHFSSRFDKPIARRAHIEMRYPKTLTCDQQVELESDVSNEKIKRAV
nr:RNA-directed DNA polymerase, eukaryota [Tanacetum cinerariifolium]